ncbi:TPA: hypothetical protein O8U62_001226 [Enterobacter kobei]|nr:hypothetical protein [Enterobacter kobei]
MKLKYLLLCATLSVAFTSSSVLASENGKKPIPGKSDVMVADICLKPEIQSETDYKKTKELVRTEFEENLPIGSKIKEKDLNAVIEAFATRKRDTPERADHCQENVRERYWEMNPVKDK